MLATENLNRSGYNVIGVRRIYQNLSRNLKLSEPSPYHESNLDPETYLFPVTTFLLLSSGFHGMFMRLLKGNFLRGVRGYWHIRIANARKWFYSHTHGINANKK